MNVRIQNGVVSLKHALTNRLGTNKTTNFKKRQNSLVLKLSIPTEIPYKSRNQIYKNKDSVFYDFGIFVT